MALALRRATASVSVGTRRRSTTRAPSSAIALGAGTTLLFALACGGASARKKPADNDAAGGGGAQHAGGSGANGGAAAESGTPAGGAAGAALGEAGEAGSAGTGEPGEPPCVLEEARCNAAFRREVCGARGWSETSFVCARTVAVDDEIGSYCVTKGDGSYRCWGEEVELAQELPADDYVRVQRSAAGVIASTADGRLVAPNHVLPTDLPPVTAFRATNMGGNPGVCPRFADGSFAILLPEYDPDGRPLGLQIYQSVGPVLDAGCSYEGLAAAVLADGSIWFYGLKPPPGNAFTAVTTSLGIFCAIETNGGIACFEPFYSCARSPGFPGCVGAELPRFPAGRYHSLAATYDAVCAIDEQGALVCRRSDGADMPIGGGPYVFAEGGRDVLCAIRRDGTTACFRQNALSSPEVSAFAGVDPPIDPGW